MLFLAVIAVLSSCGSSANTVAVTDPIVPQIDPIVIELDNFQGHSFIGERSYISYFDKQVKGQVPTVASMVKTGVMTSALALVFKNSEASVSEPRVNKKGTSYSFTIHAREAEFFNRELRTSWRISVTVNADGSANVIIESDSINTVSGSRTWRFFGHVNRERTEALKAMVGTPVK